MKNCYNCNSENIIKRSEEKHMYFRGESFTLPVAVTCCGDCGEVFSRESEAAVIKKVGKAYVKKYKLLTAKDISRIRGENNLSVIQMNELLGFPAGTIRALENGFTITMEQDEIIRKHFG